MLKKGSIFCLILLGLFPAFFVKAALASALKNEPIKPIPRHIALDKAKVELGRKLFHDRRLSRDNTISCASCHDLKKGGTDRDRFSTGIGGKKGRVNAPTVYNSGFNFRQFWDGRADSLETQAAGPIHNPIEMGSNWDEVIQKLSKDRTYIAAFQTVYSDSVRPKHIQDAIAEFERSLYTPNSKFDRYLRGDPKALSDKEKRGYELFKSYGCVACHQGKNVGGNMFQQFGVMKELGERVDTKNKVHLGRYNVTQDAVDKFVFKVPSLRLVSLTPPYFHDGSAKTLREAVDVMFEYQLGRAAPDEDKKAIIQFLKSLVGQLPTK